MQPIGIIAWLHPFPMTETKKPTGGPAFPVLPPVQMALHGMTIRDHFAGQAMQAILSSEGAILAMVDKAKAAGVTLNKMVSLSAYAQADSMIEVRSET